MTGLIPTVGLWAQVSVAETSMTPSKVEAGERFQWEPGNLALTWLQLNLRPGMHTLETGCGQSTLACLHAGCIHEAITPSAEEITAIQRVADQRGLDLSLVQFHHGFSHDILPHLKGHEDLDVAIIDGGHGFPLPGVDWLYMAPRLKVGGKMLIDDIDLWTGKILLDVLRREPGWRVNKILHGRTAIVTKLAPFVARDWRQQPTVVARSWLPQAWRKFTTSVQMLIDPLEVTVANDWP
jgi:hypothetical protein